MNNENLKIGSGYAFICLLWGSTWLMIRIGLESLTPLVAAGSRFVFASVFIWLIMRYRNVKLQTDKEAVKLYLIMGFFSFVIPFGLVYWAEQFIPSGLTSILFGTFPFFVVIFSKILIRSERVGAGKVAGIVIGFIGIYLIYSEDMNVKLNQYILGMTVVLISAAMQGWITVLIKIKGKRLNPLSMNLVPLIIAGFTMLILGILFENTSKVTIDSKAVLSVLYLAFFGTVLTFTIYYWLMKRINVIILSLSSFITPIIALILGHIILSENFSSQVVFGSGLVLTGILFANLEGLFKYFKKRTRFG